MYRCFKCFIYFDATGTDIVYRDIFLFLLFLGLRFFFENLFSLSWMDKEEARVRRAFALLDIDGTGLVRPHILVA